MEKIPRYIIFILAMLGYLSIQAQDISNQTKKASTGNEVLNVPATDPKLSQFQGSQNQTISSNPAKPPLNMFDPKISSIDPYNRQLGSSNPKPSAEIRKDPKLNEDGTLPDLKANTPVMEAGKSLITPDVKNSQDQPAGLLPKNTSNYRNLKGPSTQPTPPQPTNIEKYRDIKGPKTQPATEQPKR